MSTRQQRTRGCRRRFVDRIAWNRNRPNFTSESERVTASSRNASRAELSCWMAAKHRTGSTISFGTRSRPVFLRSQKNPKFEMAFTRDSALEFLRRAEGQNRLAHAYLISGPIGSGKRSLAAEITSAVNGTKASDVFSTAAREVFVAAPEYKSRRIVVEQIRNLEHSLQMRASAPGRRKVAIIAEADRLQPQAANAFLKTLEEPPENSLLLLLIALPEALPDTILSRCIPIPLAGVNVEPAEQQDEFVELLRAA